MKRKILNTIYTYEYLDLEELDRYGLGVEIQDFTDPSMTDQVYDRTMDFYRKAFKDYRGIKSMHGPFIDLKPSSPDRDIKDVSRKKYRMALNVARELEMDYIIFHTQINPNHIGKTVREFEKEENTKFWKETLDLFKDYKGTIVLENVFEKEPELIKELIDSIDRPNLKINLDIGHARLGQEELEEWIRILGSRIAYMHIHSNDGKYDLHQPATREEVEELYYFLDKYGLDPVLSLEYNIEDMEEEIKKYIG